MKKDFEEHQHASKEMPMNTPLNPVFSMSSELNTNNPFESEASYAGNSVNEHVAMEEANEFLAEKEISQVFENQ
ncbi:hypothetical protein LCL95_07950 [Bacillus timonensis]|nr:hypothetical protein [Bacillus timonensis]